MARIMKAVAPTVIPNATLVDVLTVPAGHKFEVLEWWLLGVGTTGTTSAVYYHPPAGYLFAFVEIGSTAPDWLRTGTFNALLLNAGDKLTVFRSSAPPAAGSFYATYMDVGPL